MRGLWRELKRRVRQRSGGRDEGQVGLLILGFSVIVILLIVLSIAVTTAQIARVRLFDVADSAALAAANSFPAGGYEGGFGRNLPVLSATARSTAAQFVAGQQKPPSVTGWRLGSATGTPDGQTAVVQLTGTVRMPLFGPVLEAFGGSVNITVTARAQAQIEAPGAP